jgi:hypothetical protein
MVWGVTRLEMKTESTRTVAPPPIRQFISIRRGALTCAGLTDLRTSFHDTAMPELNTQFS